MNNQTGDENAPSANTAIDPSRCYIRQCPVEILIAVAKNLPKSDQLELVRVSKQLAPIAQEQLYRSVFILGALKSLGKFLSAVNSRPNIARLVHSLEMNIGVEILDFHMEKLLQLPPDVQRESREPDHTSQPSFPIKCSGLGGMLLHLLPNLRSLDLVVWDENDTWYSQDSLYDLFGIPAHLCGRKLRSIPGLRKLETLILCTDNLHYSWLRLPIRRLELGDETLIELPKAQTVLNDTLQSMRMACQASIFKPNGNSFYTFIPGTLMRCPNLNRLELSVWKGFKGSGDTLLKLLSGVTGRLTDLRISDSWEMIYLHVISPATQLRYFTKLTTLLIPQKLLLGVTYCSNAPGQADLAQLLPPNIRKLEILDALLSIPRWLQDLALVGNMYSRLNETIINCRKRDKDFEKTIFTSMLPVWNTLRHTGFGVIFRYDHCDYDSYSWDEYDPFSYEMVEYIR